MRDTSIGVILSGAGYLDGTEISEAVLVLLALSSAGADVTIYAPDIKLVEVDHVTQQPTGAERSVLKEAARIARGQIKELSRARGTDHEGWVVPGGYGAAKNLSDFAERGAAGVVNKDFNRVIRDAFAARIPVGACCIAPAVIGLVAKGSSTKLKLTIGTDKDTARAIQHMGHTHVDAAVSDVVLDKDRKVVTTPAYMYADADLAAVSVGIHKMVQQVIDWSREELSAPRMAPPPARAS
ncbi:MAG TPA: isoprenoid biosynthesis glyoxalase ElbB [Myxococcota bacterium]